MGLSYARKKNKNKKKTTKQNKTEERVSLGEGDEGHANKSNKAPHPSKKYFCDFLLCKVRLEVGGVKLFFFFNSSKVCSRLTWGGCRAEPCGSRPPPHACAAWRAASATRTSCSSAAAPPLGTEKI